MKTGSIYIIKNKINDKVYIGQTTMKIEERFYNHCKPSNQKKKSSYKLYNAMRKYGSNNFYVELLEENIPLKDLDEKEILYIEKFNSFRNGYNSTYGGDGRTINIVNNEKYLLEKAKNGCPATQLAKEFNCNVATIYRTLHKLNFYYNKRPNIKQIEVLVREGKTNKEIAEIVHSKEWTINRMLKKYNIRRRKVYINKRKSFDYESLINDYVNNMKICDICDKYQINEKTIHDIRRKFNIPIRPQIYKYKIRYK